MTAGTFGLSTRASRRPLNEPPEGERDAAGGPLQFWHVGAATKKADSEAEAEARRRRYQTLFPSDTAVLESKRWGRPEERHDGAGSTAGADQAGATSRHLAARRPDSP